MECLMDHIVLNVVDENEMMDFYANVLEMAPERLKDYQTGEVPFPSIRLNSDTIIDLFPKKMWQKAAGTGRGRVNLNHFCLSMEKAEWDRLVKRLEVYKVTIEEGPVPRWGAHGTGTSIYFRDPEGNLIEARYYEGFHDAGKCLLSS